MDLVHSLRTDLGRDFSVSLCPQDDLLRAPGIAPVERVKDDFYKDIVVVGASNLNQTAPSLRVKGATVQNITKWGTELNQGDVRDAKLKISNTPDGADVAVILDLFGNAAFRYEQPDSNLALPC